MNHSGLSLLTDLYQLTMAQAYWSADMAEHEAVFHLFYRKNPFKGGFAISCGLEDATSFLEAFTFDESDIGYLSTLKGADGQSLFQNGFLEWLGEMRFSCEVDAIPEGTLVFPHEPILRIQGPLIQCQLLETALLNILNFQTLIATKAARICLAANGEDVLEFGLRRAQGINGGLAASRAAYVGGCVATSNVLAGKLFDIPVRGTHAHSWVMCFDDEITAFETYADSLPNNCVFLVDTYDTIQGVRHAIEVGEALQRRGHALLGIRLDSGDLADLSIKARKLLDEAGFHDAKIVASNDLDEYRITQLKEEGAEIRVWGVGTRLATAYDQPALGGVFKLAAIRAKGDSWQYRVKLSEQAIKVSNPGIQQVRRFIKDGKIYADMIHHEPDTSRATAFSTFSGEEVQVEGQESMELLHPIFRNGKKVYQSPSVHAVRENCLLQLSQLSDSVKKLNNPSTFPVGLEPQLLSLKRSLIQRYRPTNM
ncbi:MAG: nicotinate phosphoribosyltransferase [Bacteroidota bacterium]